MLPWREFQEKEDSLSEGDRRFALAMKFGLYELSGYELNHADSLLRWSGFTVLAPYLDETKMGLRELVDLLRRIDKESISITDIRRGLEELDKRRIC